MFDIIGMNVREARLSHGWSQRFFASQLNISHQSISRLENGYPVSSHLLKKVAGLLQISLHELYQSPNELKPTNCSIPDNTMSKMLLNSQPLFECVYKEAILRYKFQLKRNGVLLQKDIEGLVEQFFNKKDSYTLSDLVYIGMLANQKTIENAMLL